MFLIFKYDIFEDYSSFFIYLVNEYIISMGKIDYFFFKGFGLLLYVIKLKIGIEYKIEILFLIDCIRVFGF